MYGGFDTIISNFSSFKFVNISELINVIWFSTLLLIAFFLAIFNASLLISIAVISACGKYLASDTAIAPLPVHKSNIFFALFFFAIFITSSTNISVSCLGIKTFLSTKKLNFMNSFWCVICSIGTPFFNIFISSKYCFSLILSSSSLSFTITYCLDLFNTYCINSLAFNFGSSIFPFFSSIIPFFISSDIVI